MLRRNALMLLCTATAGILRHGMLLAQGTPQTQGIDIPATATSLEGIPTVRIDTTESAARRRVLSQNESAKSRLTIRIVDGQYYWTSRDNRPLRLDASGNYTYLSSEPGRYIRLTRMKDRITYVEHVDRDDAQGYITWWGELRIVLGK